MSEMLNIYQRIDKVRQSCAYIKKDKKVGGAGEYMAVTHDAVTRETRDDFAKAGIIIVPFLDGQPRVIDTGKTMGSKSIPVIRFEAEFIVRFVNMDNPADLVEVRLPAHAEDHGDKAPGKAISYAVKYALLKVLQIETGEDDEARLDTESGIMPAAQIAEWRKKIDELKDVDLVNPLWELCLKACREAKDAQAATSLRAHLTAKATAIKKASAGKVPQERKAA
jgi:hypothetical protein